MELLFLTYVNRSGSTFLANLLSSSRNICVCPEGDWLVHYFLEAPGKGFNLTPDVRQVLEKKFISDAKLSHWDPGEGLFSDLATCKTNFDAFCTILESSRSSQKPEATFILFKSERLSALMHGMGTLNREGTGIRVLSLVRDPRAVIASQLNTNMPGTNRKMAGNVVHAGLKWLRYVKQVTRVSDAAVQVIIRYEDLITGTSLSIRKLEDFLKMDLSGVNPHQGDLLERLPGSHKKIHRLVGQEPEQDRTSAWEQILSERDQYLVERICRNKLSGLGYKRTDFQIRPGLEIYLFIGLLSWHIRKWIKILIYHGFKFFRRP